MLSRLYGVLLPFFVSFLLAWLLDPLVNFIQHKCRVKFRGQGLVALCVGILFAIGFSIIGMPMGFVMGLIVGILNLVPYMQALGISCYKHYVLHEPFMSEQLEAAKAEDSEVGGEVLIHKETIIQ